MCLLLFAYRTDPGYRLILGANRDEFYDRPTQALSFWDDFPDILAGRDLKCLGTWFGITRQGRLAAVTNFRNPRDIRADAPSRGDLTSNFLKSHAPPRAYLEKVAAAGERYNGFNLLVGDRSGLLHYSNRGGGICELPPGVYGISNHLLDTPWPKIEKGKAALQLAIDETQAESPQALIEAVFALLQDRAPFADHSLPDTGVGLEWERILAPLFVQSPVYGTRSSLVLLITQTEEVFCEERTHIPARHKDAPAPPVRRYHFRMGPAQGE